jgi:predicted transcriptional regulator
VLEVRYPAERDLRLDGRGLLLQPSVFCWRMPITRLDPADQPVLVYPITTTDQSFGPQHRAVATGALTRLLGRTRCAALEACESGTTTGELATRLGIAPSTASEHVSVLRRAGLVATRTEGIAVRHRITDLGHRLLNASVPL